MTLLASEDGGRFTCPGDSQGDLFLPRESTPT